MKLDADVLKTIDEALDGVTLSDPALTVSPATRP